MLNDDKFSIPFIEAVLRRPKMYTTGGTLEEVVAFLTGFYSGFAKGDVYSPSVRRWMHFQDWLAEQLGIPPSPDLFRDFKAKLDIDQDAFTELLKWLSRFNAEFPAMGTTKKHLPPQ